MSDAADQAPQTDPAGIDATVRSGLKILVADGLKGLDRLPMLGTVTDLLATALTGSLRALLGAEAEVHVEPPRTLPIQMFYAGVAAGTPAALLRIEPWGGRCLAVIGSAVAATAIERLLGGRRSQAATLARRSFTAIERAVVERLARDMIARNLAAALVPAGASGVILERLETDAARISLGKPAAPAVLLHADVRRGDSLGSIDVLIPNTALEPMRDRLSQGQDLKDGTPDEAWRAHLTAELPATRVRLQAVIEQRRVQAAELLRWQVGSKLVLSRRHDEPIDVFCNDLLVLRGRIAEKDGRIALHIEERRIADDRPFAQAPQPAAAPPDAAPPAPAAAPPSLTA